MMGIEIKRLVNLTCVATRASAEDLILLMLTTIAATFTIIVELAAADTRSKQTKQFQAYQVDR